MNGISLEGHCRPTAYLALTEVSVAALRNIKGTGKVNPTTCHEGPEE